jgi:hypothetical protein
MSEKCVICDKSTDLNTKLTIALENGDKVAVQICDEHAEDTTVKIARKAYLEKQDKIKELIEHAKSLGLEISINPSGLSIATEKPGKSPEPQKVMPHNSVSEGQIKPENGKNVIPTSIIDSKRFNVQINNNQGHPSLPAYSTSSLEDKLPEGALEGFAEVAIVEGRGGQPLAIPQKRTDRTGTTHITIKNNQSDRTLQDRFKNMASASMHDKIDFARGGYNDTTRKCPICSGLGLIRMKNEEKPCPKCNGSGTISVY